MSKEYRNVSIGFTVLDSEDLPHGMYADDVVADLSEAIQRAVSAWYADRGRFFLACEPV